MAETTSKTVKKVASEMTAANRKVANKPTVTSKRPSKKAATGAGMFVTQEARSRMIAEAAYHRAAQRGFTDGDHVADWLAAESEVDAKLAAGGISHQG